jgi:hypothetical protein
MKYVHALLQYCLAQCELLSALFVFICIFYDLNFIAQKWKPKRELFYYLQRISFRMHTKSKKMYVLFMLSFFRSLVDLQIYNRHDVKCHLST